MGDREDILEPHKELLSKINLIHDKYLDHLVDETTFSDDGYLIGMPRLEYPNKSNYDFDYSQMLVKIMRFSRDFVMGLSIKSPLTSRESYNNSSWVLHHLHDLYLKWIEDFYSCLSLEKERLPLTLTIATCHTYYEVSKYLNKDALDKVYLDLQHHLAFHSIAPMLSQRCYLGLRVNAWRQWHNKKTSIPVPIPSVINDITTLSNFYLKKD